MIYQPSSVGVASPLLGQRRQRLRHLGELTARKVNGDAKLDLRVLAPLKRARPKMQVPVVGTTPCSSRSARYLLTGVARDNRQEQAHILHQHDNLHLAVDILTLNSVAMPSDHIALISRTMSLSTATGERRPGGRSSSVGCSISRAMTYVPDVIWRARRARPYIKVTECFLHR